MLRSLVGSEMCIRDSPQVELPELRQTGQRGQVADVIEARVQLPQVDEIPVSYTHLTLPTIYSV